MLHEDDCQIKPLSDGEFRQWMSKRMNRMLNRARKGTVTDVFITNSLIFQLVNWLDTAKAHYAFDSLIGTYDRQIVDICKAIGRPIIQIELDRKFDYWPVMSGRTRQYLSGLVDRFTTQ